MTVYTHHCGWNLPHAPHVSIIVHPEVPSLVSHLSCTGTPA